MSEQQYGRRAIEWGPTSKTVAANIARMRERRGFTTRQLEAELRKAGRPISASGISKMEREQRQVTVDDLVTLSALFGVSPSALLLPPTDDPSVTLEITGVGVVAADQAWDWMDGRRRLDVSCADPDTAALEYALHSRPPVRRKRELGAA